MDVKLFAKIPRTPIRIKTIPANRVGFKCNLTFYSRSALGCRIPALRYTPYTQIGLLFQPVFSAIIAPMRPLLVSIVPLTAEHWDAVRAIYLEGIATGNATFQQSAPEWPEWHKGHLPNCRFVALRGNQVIGWAALTSVSSRCVYAGVAEVSVYVAESAQRQGVGATLLGALITESEAAGIWTLQAGIFPENASSLALHARAGFRVVGTRERLGQMNSRWRDVVLLERRSSVVGV